MQWSHRQDQLLAIADDIGRLYIIQRPTIMIVGFVRSNDRLINYNPCALIRPYLPDDDRCRLVRRAELAVS